MKKWVIGGALLGAAGVGAYFALPTKTPATPVDPQFYSKAVAAPAPIAPVVLAKVVDVTDIDPLLDPPAIPVSEPPPAGPTLTAIGYDEQMPAAARPDSAATPIPPADESEPPGVEVAPMPREANKMPPGFAGQGIRRHLQYRPAD